MRVDLFDFELPQHFIANRPATPRDSAKLLVVDPKAENPFSDRIVRELPEVLKSGDVLVLNDTRVIPARLFGRRDAVNVEVTLCRSAGDVADWWTLSKPGKRLKPGQTVIFKDRQGRDAPLRAEIVEKDETGQVRMRFDAGDAGFFEVLQEYGVMPLPPYIAREHGSDAQDASDYQTVFAKREGAVAAPTAGLHFTPDLLSRLGAAGVETTRVTLHVGAGTFLPVKVDDTKDHKMHAEYGVLSGETAAFLNEVRREGRRIVAVGTTAFRLLESAVDENGVFSGFEGETDIFITPGCPVYGADVLMTNFHLPRSTLFMLVSAFSGLDMMRAAYSHAMEQNYRFYSYGDSSLLFKKG